MGLAILRFRLWDIDLVINRTLVYGTLTISLTALYLAIVESWRFVQARGSLLVSLVAAAWLPCSSAAPRLSPDGGQPADVRGKGRSLWRPDTCGERVSAALVPEAALQAIAETVAGAVKLPYVAIALKQGDTSTPAVAH